MKLVAQLLNLRVQAGVPTAAPAHRPAPALRTRILRLGAVFVATSVVGLSIAVGDLSFRAARTIVYPARGPSAASPSDYGLPYERVSFKSLDGLNLAGWLVPGGRAAVVLAHGHDASKGEILDQAGYLNRAGYAVLLFDFRASGESEGTASTLGYYEWQDIAGAGQYLRARPELDSGRIGVLGASMGAAAAIMLGPEARRFAAVVADSSFATGESLVGRFDRWFRLPTWPFSALVPLAVQHYVGLTPRQVAPIGAVGMISPTPLFIIHGALDSGIPAQDAEVLYAAAGDPKELWMIEGGSHADGHGLVKDEYERRVLGFFGRYLQ